MKVGEFYSTLSLIFATNFNQVLGQNSFENIKKSQSWVIKNNTQNYEVGEGFYKDFLENESLAELRTDFRSIKEIFQARYYFEGTNNNLTQYYNAFGFKCIMGETDSISNQLMFIATILKQDLNEQSEKILVTFLIKFFLPYSTLLCEDLKNRSKSSFYKSMGYFLDDFCDGLKKVFEIKQK